MQPLDQAANRRIRRAALWERDESHTFYTHPPVGAGGGAFLDRVALSVDPERAAKTSSYRAGGTVCGALECCVA